MGHNISIWQIFDCAVEREYRIMWKSDDWKNYELIDASDGERLERWGDIILVRPDPQIIWNTGKSNPLWRSCNARYIRSNKGGGAWDIKSMPDGLLDRGWELAYKELVFKVRPTGFKHTGVFPEQAVNWDYADKKIRNAGREISVINLFAYTGGATIACAKAGAKVCHVDASKGMVAWARENAALSGLADAPIRYIVDDCKKFLEREIRRGRKYDALIMDPPSYGRGPSGEVWKLEDGIDELIGLAVKVLSDDPLFVIVNSYTTGLSAASVGCLLELHMRNTAKGCVTSDEIGIPVTDKGIVLPSGSTARWDKD